MHQPPPWAKQAQRCQVSPVPCGAWGHGVPACTLMALGARQMCQHQLKQGRCDLLLSKGLAATTQPGKLLA